MIICVYLHMYPPIHMAGSETTVHAAMRAMVNRGHDVTVIADRTPESYEHEGVKVLAPPRNHQQEAIRELAKDADILITHLDVTSQAMALATDLHKPLVHFVHNDAQLSYWHVDPHVPYRASLVVFNSQWIAEREKFHDELWAGDYIVLHPVVEPERYKCEKGSKITFCNPTIGKGVETVYKLAEQMPDYEFLVVEGIYGEQVAPPNLGDEWVKAHPNIEFMANNPDFREVLKKTKVLLMPSGYESYGRCAVEAACAGIPSIVHPTEGLLEALGAERVPRPRELDCGWVSGAGIYCDREDIESWKLQIERLYADEIYYRSRSDAALKLAASFDPEADFDRLEQALLVTAAKWNSKENSMNRMWTSDRRLYKRPDGSITPNAAEGQSLYVGIGGEIPETEAVALGLIPNTQPTERVEPLLDTKALTAPTENKAQPAPDQVKAKRVKKTA